MVLVFIPFLLLGDIFYLVLGSMLGIFSLWELIRLEKNMGHGEARRTCFENCSFSLIAGSRKK